MPHFPASEKPAAAKSGLSFRIKPSPTATTPSETTDARSQRIRIKNRRKRYLDLHPEYFKSAELELADPLLYDRLVRRFLSTSEREKQGRERGYTGVLEADLVRSEAKIEALQHPDPNSPLVYKRAGDGSIIGVEQDEDDRAQTQESGWEYWVDFMGQRFLRGEDRSFDYTGVDESEEYDDRDEEERKKLEEYFDAETPKFIGEAEAGPSGETGVQDF